MSRIGNKPISLPSGVTVTVDENNVVTVKGPKGELNEKIDRDLSVSVEDGNILVSRPTEQKRHKAMHGLYRTLIGNMVTGVSDGYVKELELVGVGYKAEMKGDLLELNVGYSHLIAMVMPSEIKASAETVKGKNPIVRLESIDKQLIGAVAAKIRGFRKPEPYKGKGIRYRGEQIRRKAGKTGAK